MERERQQVGEQLENYVVHALSLHEQQLAKKAMDPLPQSRQVACKGDIEEEKKEEEEARPDCACTNDSLKHIWIALILKSKYLISCWLFCVASIVIIRVINVLSCHLPDIIPWHLFFIIIAVIVIIAIVELIL